MPTATAPRLPASLQRAVHAHQTGDLPTAVTGYRRFLARHPRNAGILRLLALGLADLGRGEEAVEALERATALEPADADLRALLIAAHRAQGNAAGAFAAAQAALTGDAVAATPALLVAAAQAAVAVDADDEAVAWCRRALLIDASCASAMVVQAIALRRQERHLEALRVLERALQLDDPTGLAHYELGVLRSELGEVTEPLRLIRRAAELDPTNAAFWSGEGMVLNRLGRFEESAAAYARARALRPHDPLLEANQSWPLIGARDFARGWAQHDASFATGGRTPNRTFSVPRWRGAADAGRLLVWREQGIGDEIRCASMIPDAIARAGDIVVECEPRLVSLFQRSFPLAEVRPQRLDAVHDFDVHCPMASLAQHLRPDVDSYRRQGPYLRPDPDRVSRMRERIGPRRALEVGISWRSMTLSTKRLSHYTVLDEWGPILGVEGVRFWNLQYGRPDLLEQERAMVRERFGVDIEVVDGLDYTDDMESLAALIANLDVVTSVGTAVACLAGAVGVPVHLLAVDFDPFRFGQPDYPWFGSVEVVARHPEQPWDGAMARAAQRLRELR